MIGVGDKAPIFELKDQNGNAMNLSDLEGKLALLSFHPLAWTRICAEQMQSLEENLDRFTSLNTVPLGISVDSAPSKKAWAESLGIKRLQLLADFWPHGGVAKSYGIFRNDEGFSERTNILVNEMGQVIFAKVYPIKEPPDFEEILSMLSEQQFTVK
jgi:peroxiredoxin